MGIRFGFALLCICLATGFASGAGVSPYLSRVLEYCPAPGQFVNGMPEYEAGDTYKTVILKAEEQICGSKTPGMITLGAFGGYVTVAFDHPVLNVAGAKDFKIYGNALPSNASNTSGSSEPGIVWVSVDANGNGLPDDEWYQLAGSEHFKLGQISGCYGLPYYNCLYYRPSVNREPEVDPGSGKEYDPDPVNTYVTDSKYIEFHYAEWCFGTLEETDWLRRVSFHSQPYWPQWVEDDELFFSGGMLPENFTILGGEGVPSYSQKPFEWGYVDNQPNSVCEGFDIGDAVDRKGHYVELTHADFIRIQTGVMQQCGWLGESSTEVCGGEDLHPDAVPADVEAVIAETAEGVYTLDGLKVADRCEADGYETSGLLPGVYILRRANKTSKILIK